MKKNATKVLKIRVYHPGKKNCFFFPIFCQIYTAPKKCYKHHSGVYKKVPIFAKTKRKKVLKIRVYLPGDFFFYFFFYFFFLLFFALQSGGARAHDGTQRFCLFFLYFFAIFSQKWVLFCILHYGV